MRNWYRYHRFSWWCFFFLLLYLVPLHAQAEDQDKVLSEENQLNGWERFCDFVVGEAAADAVCLGMWSYHFFDDDEESIAQPTICLQ